MRDHQFTDTESVLPDGRAERSECCVCVCLHLCILSGCSCGCVPIWGLSGNLFGRIHAFSPLLSPPPTLSQLPEVLSSGHVIPESLQTPLGEEAAQWSQIRKDLCSLKISLQLRGEDGSVWNYKPPADSSGKEIFSILPHIADISTYMFKGIINFAKVISHFR